MPILPLTAGFVPGNVESEHHAIETVRVDQQIDRWGLLRIFDR
jgi:hypothetical protein